MEPQTPISPFGWDYINDLSCLSVDNDPVDFILHRVERGQIYTWVGPLLLAVNPENQIIEDFYDESHQSKYTGTRETILRNQLPHVYAIASRARYGLIQGLGKICQVIVISGESGTGKTFNSRQILDFLAGIDKNTAKLKFPDGVTDVAHEIGNVCPLISAFSTASTERNPKSSRHGQLIQLQYKEGVIKGACVHSFLLERTRVTRESNNFDIFYQMMAGLSSESLKDLGLSCNEEYTILGENDTSQADRYATEFKDTIRAMQTLGFTETCKTEILQVLALLLHMGNIKFREVSSESCIVNVEDENSRRAMENACKLSNLHDNELEELLTSTLICPTSKRRRHTMYRRGLKTAEACRHRLFSIIRCIYDGLFHWLVDRINENIRAKENNLDWLGILDIFGFESFATNGIEQLCINYSTERLQLYFMENYLENGQKELAEEGLSVFPAPPTIDIYRDRVNIIEQNLFSTMNDVCHSPIVPDISKISQQFFMKHQAARNFLKAPTTTSFTISHYSRPVQYDISDILEKNTDKVPIELSSTFYETHNSLLKITTNVPEDSLNNQGRVTTKKGTTLSKLKSSMDSLMQQLNKCDTHYIKCVKPLRVETTWEKEEFRNQLISSGILDALPLTRCQFPIRLSYDELFRRYHLPAVSDDNKSQIVKTLGNVVCFQDIATHLHLGNRKIFLTESLFFELENYRKDFRSICAKKIINFWRKYKTTKPKVNNSNIEPSPGVESSGIVLLKPSIVVTRPSLNSYDENDDVFVEKNSPAVPLQRDMDNNSIDKPEVLPQIALNDHIVESFSPMASHIPTPTIQTRVEADCLKHQQITANSHGWRAKDLYVAEWLETISPPSDMNLDDIDTFNKPSTGSESSLRTFLTPRHSKKLGMYSKFPSSGTTYMFKNLPMVEWNVDGSHCIIHEDKNKRMFYRNRILSKRHISESPVRFHTKKTCLVNSHCLPQSELPRGLQDCL